MAIVKVAGVEYHMNNHLVPKWDKIKDGKLKKQDNDKVYVVDGRERSGKSTFALQQACYIDPTLIHDIKRICFSAEEFLEAIRKTDSDEKTTKCIVFDEAFRGLSSRGAMSKVNKKIITALMEVGQKNLVIWIVLPSFFMLDLYAAMLRSNALFHIALDKKSNKRVFYVYPHKKKGYLYQSGVRKGWNYDIKTKSKGYFYNNFPSKAEDPVVKAFYKRYLEKKRSSLVESEGDSPEIAEDNKMLGKIKQMCYKMVKIDGKSLREAEKVLNSIGFEITNPTVMKYADEVEKNLTEKAKITMFLAENREKMLIASY